MTSFHILQSVIQCYVTYAADEESFTKQSNNKKEELIDCPVKMNELCVTAKC
jgi:hypothetical protein